MQSDPPQGDPRLQRINPGPEVATAFFDPCLVYVETILSNKLPCLMVCFAGRSSEIVEPGRASSLELRDLLVMRSKPDPRVEGRWTFALHQEKKLTLERGLLIGVTPKSYSLPPKLTREPEVVLKQSIRYLDQKTASELRKSFEASRSPNYPHLKLAKQVLEFTKLDWSIIADILSSDVSFIPKPPKRRRISLVGRLISVFKKKQKPVHA